MDTTNLKAILTEEERDLYLEDSLEAFRKLLKAQPERFRLRAEPAAFPPRKKKDHRRKLPEALRAVRITRPLPSRLPWELLPQPEPARTRTRVIYQTLPAEELARLVRTRMTERRITMEDMAAFLHISSVTFRKWLRCPETMTVRDYGDLAAWVSRQSGSDAKDAKDAKDVKGMKNVKDVKDVKKRPTV